MEDKLTWLIGAYGTIIAFMIGVLTSLYVKVYSIDKGLAVNTTHDNGRDSEIHDIKLTLELLKNEVKNLNLSFIKMKEINNNILIRLNRLLDELE